MPARVITAAAAAAVLAFSPVLDAQQPPARRSTAAAAVPSKVTVPVEYHKLDNGLKVVLSRDASSPTAVVGVYFNIGFRIEPKDRTGFAHLFEHMMFQGSRASRQERVHRAGRVERRHSQRIDALRLHQLLRDRSRHTVETILWAEADRMRGLNITQDNLTNQQGVVKNEVKVNVLNQPYGGFPWLDLPQVANTNWYNAHNFYGDLAASRRGHAGRRPAVLQDLLRAEQRRARRDRRHRHDADARVGAEIFRRHPVVEARTRSPTSRSRARRRRSGRTGTILWRTGRHSRSVITRRTATPRSSSRWG